MSAKLEVRLSQYLLGPSAAQGAVATVYPLEERTASSRQSVIIGAGGGEASTVEVDAGRYLVEVLLPSGETISDEVAVEEGGLATVDLQGKASPHEWLSWQRLVGNVGRGSTYIDPGEAGGPVPVAPDTPVAAGAPVARWIAEPAAPMRGDGPSGDAWTLVAGTFDATKRTVHRRLTPNGAEQLAVGDADEQHQLYRLGGDGAAQSSQPLPARGDPLPRRYLLVEAKRWTELLCVPVPWINQMTNEQSVVEALVRTAPEHGEAGIATTLRDSQFGAALSYMTIGALSEARKLYEPARDMLFGKVVNPLAAAAGGYVLLGTDAPEGAADWPDWIENLRNWFPWLSDGSIQAGWLRLKRRRDAADVDDARTAFHEAVARGLPYYSLGIQRLVEGLTMFEGDAETDRLLAQVRAVAWHANLQQPFTTLRLRG
jgi:hypothetical protein